MKHAFRTFALPIGALCIVACSTDKRATKDVLAEDSTLALAVMSAKADSITIQAPDTTSPSAADTPVTAPSTSVGTTAPAASPSIALNSVPAEPESKRRAQSTTPARMVRRSSAVRTARRSSSSRATRIARTQPARSQARVSSASSETRISSGTRGSSSVAVTQHTTARAVETTQLKSSAMLPTGTQLSLASDQRICASMARVGDTFATRISNDVIGPVGVVIPKGAVALAQIGSTKNNLDVDMKSISFAGHTYLVSSDVTYTELEKVRRKTSMSKSKVAGGAAIGGVAGAVLGGNPASTVLGAAAGGLAGAAIGRPRSYQDQCVPSGGRIDIKLTEPLKVALSE